MIQQLHHPANLPKVPGGIALQAIIVSVDISLRSSGMCLTHPADARAILSRDFQWRDARS